MLKPALACLILSVSSAANASLIFDFSWSGDDDLDSSILTSLDSSLLAVGTIEIDAKAGESFSFSDVLSTNIYVTGDSIIDFWLTTWTEVGGTISADGSHASFTAAGYPHLADDDINVNQFGCVWRLCGQDDEFKATMMVGQYPNVNHEIIYTTSSQLLASMKMTIQSASVPAPSTFSIFALGLIGLIGLVSRRFKKKS